MRQGELRSKIYRKIITQARSRGRNPGMEVARQLVARFREEEGIGGTSIHRSCGSILESRRSGEEAGRSRRRRKKESRRGQVSGPDAGASVADTGE